MPEAFRADADLHLLKITTALQTMDHRRAWQIMDAADRPAACTRNRKSCACAFAVELANEGFDHKKDTCPADRSRIARSTASNPNPSILPRNGT